jgi:PHD/YefM family antitoxin component YafN of YafNO toxin-antitoxin module
VILTSRGKGDTVLINYEDYAEYAEYVNTKRILGKLKEAEEYMAGSDAKWHSEEDFWAQIEASL